MTGEVAGLFPKDEMDTMLNDVRPVFKREASGNALWTLACSYVLYVIDEASRQV